jgi:predicted Zn finger-like uncharacterized protein
VPIAVNCPHCSAAFNVKDEYAGKRAKCPSCKEPLTIPGVGDTVKMPPPAKPVAARKPKPAEVDEEPVSPMRKRGARADAEDDDAPVSPKRRRGASADADEEEERPRSNRKRRDEDDDKPKKKGSPLPLILGIVGGLFLLCGGGCAGVWAFGLFSKDTNTVGTVPIDTELEAFRTNVSKVKVGMDLAEVEATLGGKGVRPTEAEVGAVTDLGSVNVFDQDKRWKGKNALGHVRMWNSGPHRALVAFSMDPDAGGTVLGVNSKIGSQSSFSGQLFSVDPQTPTPQIETTAVELAEDLQKNGKDWKTKYQGKGVKLTGEVGAVVGPGEFMLSVERNPRPGTPAGFSCYLAQDQIGVVQLKAKDRVTVVGVIDFQLDGKVLSVKNCRLIGKPVPGGGTATAPGTPPTVGGVLTVDALVKDSAKYDGKVVVVSGKVSGVEDEIQPPWFELAGPGKTKIQCNPTAKGWGKLPSVGDTVTLRGTLSVYDMVDGTKSYSLNQSQLVTGK